MALASEVLRLAFRHRITDKLMTSSCESHCWRKQLIVTQPAEIAKVDINTCDRRDRTLPFLGDVLVSEIDCWGGGASTINQLSFVLLRLIVRELLRL